LPLRGRFGSKGSQGGSRDEVALKVEVVVDGSVHIEKTLRGARRLEPLHPALSSSHRLMRVLSTVVCPQPLLMAAGQTKVPERGAVGSQFVGG
jgi:hypothetical protein